MNLNVCTAAVVGSTAVVVINVLDLTTCLCGNQLNRSYKSNC